MRSLGIAPATTDGGLDAATWIYFELDCGVRCTSARQEDVSLIVHVLQSAGAPRITRMRADKIDHFSTGRETLHVVARSEEHGAIDLLLHEEERGRQFALTLDALAAPVRGAVVPADFRYQEAMTDAGPVAAQVYHCDCLCSFCKDFEWGCDTLKGGLSTEPDGTITCSIPD